MHRFYKVLFLFILVSVNLFAVHPVFKVPHSIGSHFYDFQNFKSLAYFHGGMDICAPAGSPVYTPVSGYFKFNCYRIDASNNPPKFEYTRWQFNGRNTDKKYALEFSVTDHLGRNWMLRHIDPDTVPRELIRMQNSYIFAGTQIGNLYRWMYSVKPEARKYHHIHLEVLSQDGEYLNPYTLLPNLKDDIAPTIHKIWLRDKKTKAIFFSIDNVIQASLPFEIIIATTDQMNAAKYFHSVYKAGFEISTQEEDSKKTTIVAKHLMNFEQLPFKGDRTQQVKNYYVSQLTHNYQKWESNGNTGPRFFILNLTRPESAIDLSQKLEKSKTYNLKVFVEDQQQNRTENIIPIEIN